MSESKDATHNLSEPAPGQLDMTPEKALEAQAKVISASIDQARMLQTYLVGLSRYLTDFMAPAFSALESFSAVESEKLENSSPEETIRDYAGLLEFNLRLAETRPDPWAESPQRFPHAPVGAGLQSLAQHSISAQG